MLPVTVRRHPIFIVTLLALLVAGAIELFVVQHSSGLSLERERALQLFQDCRYARQYDRQSDMVDETVRAYHILLYCYAEDIDTAAVLTAGWRAALSEAVSRADAGNLPRFVDTQDDEHSFRDSLRRLLTPMGKDDSRVTAQAAIAAMAEFLHDDHTAYFALDDVPEYFDDGISAVPVEGGLLVWEAIIANGSPALKADIRQGDLIVAIDGKPATMQALGLPAFGLRDRVTYTVQRPGVGRVDLKVTAGSWVRPRLSAELLDSDVAYVRLNTFSLTSASDSLSVLTRKERKAEDYDPILQKVADRNPRGWVLDLRNNSGGEVDWIPYIAGRLGATGRIEAIDRYHTGAMTVKLSSFTGGKPVVVLVNGLSASASEVTAAMFQEDGSALIAGSHTPGLVNESQLVIVGRGALQVTTARVLVGASQRKLGGIGVTPDLPVELDAAQLAAGTDPQLQAAVDYINSK